MWLLCLATYEDTESSGEVSLEVSAYRHPATGEFDGSIRGTLYVVGNSSINVVMRCYV